VLHIFVRDWRTRAARIRLRYVRAWPRAFPGLECALPRGILFSKASPTSPATRCAAHTSPGSRSHPPESPSIAPACGTRPASLAAATPVRASTSALESWDRVGPCAQRARASSDSRDRLTTAPFSSSTATAPGCSCAPRSTIARSSCAPAALGGCSRRCALRQGGRLTSDSKGVQRMRARQGLCFASSAGGASLAARVQACRRPSRKTPACNPQQTAATRAPRHVGAQLPSTGSTP